MTRFAPSAVMVSRPHPRALATSIGYDREGVPHLFFRKDGPYAIPDNFSFVAGQGLSSFVPTQDVMGSLRAEVSLGPASQWIRDRHAKFGDDGGPDPEGLFVHVHYNQPADWHLEGERITQCMPFLQGYRVIHHAEFGFITELPVLDPSIHMAWMTRRKVEAPRSCSVCGPKEEQPSRVTSRGGLPWHERPLIHSEFEKTVIEPKPMDAPVSKLIETDVLLGRLDKIAGLLGMGWVNRATRFEKCVDLVAAVRMNDKLTKELAESEASVSQLIGQRDRFEERIDQIADALGDETEWSNLNDRGEQCLERIALYEEEIKQLKKLLDKMQAVDDLCPACFASRDSEEAEEIRQLKTKVRKLEDDRKRI